jgi:hypothetical protein
MIIINDKYIKGHMRRLKHVQLRARETVFQLKQDS